MATGDETDDAGTEILVASIVLALGLLRHASWLRGKAAERLQDLQGAILAEISRGDLEAIQRPAVRQIHADRLGAEIDRLIGQTYAAILADLEAALSELGATVAEHTATTLRRVVDQPVQEPSKGSTAATVGAAIIAGAVLGAWLSKAAGDTSFRVRRAVNDAAANGVGAAETVAQIRVTVDAAKAGMDTIIRTATTATSATATDQVIRANPRIVGTLWCSILDGRTTQECKSRANLKWDADRAPIGHTKPFRLPPIHPNCRSSVIPWLIDAPAPREPTLDEFLKSRTASEQEVLIGRKKISLWRQGKLTASGLLDQSARPLDLAQLRRMLGL
jgi:hypothetical protein